MVIAQVFPTDGGCQFCEGLYTPDHLIRVFQEVISSPIVGGTISLILGILLSGMALKMVRKVLMRFTQVPSEGEVGDENIGDMGTKPSRRKGSSFSSDDSSPSDIGSGYD
jgi:hypothetical protein